MAREARLLHDLVGADPGRVAVRAGTRTLTYAELADAANGLAGRLVRAGAEPDAVAGIRLPRGLGLPVAVLAVLRSGMAYLPLTPWHPAAPQEALLARASARFLVTASGHALDTAVPVVPVDDPEPAAPESPVRPGVLVDVPEPAAVPESPVRPGNLAYVLPTSGTTGQPKLVAVPHEAAANTLTQVAAAWALGPGDVALQLADIGYSAAVRDILGPLTSGATLELVESRGAQAVQAVARRLAEGTVTCLLSCLPQVLSALLDLDTPPGDLRLVVIISETLPAELVDRVRRRWGRQVRFVHQYGLTECAMTSLMGDVPEDPGERVPVGWPIANTRALLLDEDLRPVPPGTPGELYIGGAGLARGYHGDPALTAERFVPDPFTPGARLYRTGDLASRHADGAIECHGRTDRQLKVRGHRVELDEIELALRTHPDVRAAAVQAHEQNGEPVLVGYVVPRAAVPPDSGSLTAHLARTLPEPLTALRYVMLAGLPALPNGKIDRRALPQLPAAPGLAEPSNEVSDVERAVTETWRQVLGVPALGREDDVFTAGAHSMHVVRVTARLRRRVAAELRVEEVFEHRTIAALTAWLESAARPPAASALPPGPATVRQVSPAQRSLWFLDRLRPGGSAYTIAFALDFDEPIDVARLRTAVERVVARHDALRTGFADEDGHPRAFVRSGPAFEFAVADVAEPAWAGRPTDLAADPLLRIAVRPDGGRAWFAMHHIVTDDASVGVFLRDLTTAYAGRSLPAAPAYGDAEPAVPSPAWVARLRAVPDTLRLPVTRPQVQTDQGGVVWRTLPDRLVAAMTALADTTRATPFMVALAAWSVLMWRSSGQESMLIGTIGAGRTRSEHDDAVGLFANLLPVPLHIDPDEPFSMFLGRVRTDVLDTLDQAEVPFGSLVEILAPERGTAHAPLVQVACDWVEEPPESWTFGGVRARLRDIEPEAAKFDLWLSLRQRGGTVRARLEYRGDLIDPATADRLADRLETVLQAAVDRPDLPVHELPVMPAGEYRQAVSGGDDTHAERPEGTVLDLLHDHEGTALRCGDRELSHARLRAASDAVAARLAARGAGPGMVVAVCLPRTSDLVVALLGVLKSGAGYLPLDPAYPLPRLNAMLALAQPSILLTDGTTGRAVTVPPGTTVVDLRAPATSTSKPVRPHPDDLAYLLFTSGSTGVPKGVAITHRGLLNLVTWGRRAFSGAELATVAACTSVCFDLSVFEIFTPLSAGGTVELLDDVLALRHSPAADRITLLNTVPSALRALLDDPPALPALLRVNVAGEPLRASLVEHVAQTLPGRRVTNLYGPTETTTYSTAADCLPHEPVTIGHPIANTRILLLDRHLHPVPPGTPGELYIGGAGLARGYHGDPALTAERFVPDPFTPGARLYRTGDLASRRADGSIEYHGRTDRQLKIRGHRIEPGEVEAALHTHPAVRQAVAGPRPDPSGGPRLLAWVVPDGEVTAAELRDHLGTRLPGYLVPSVITLIDTVPHLPNGKIDWPALPDPAPGTDRNPAMTAAEKAVAKLWRDLLDVPITADTHFFAAGGHSIAATRLISRVNATFGTFLPVSSLFDTPVLRQFAAAVEEAILRDIIEQRGNEGMA
ncbi:amino acid adenylation domain-containing protein [Nonomuraea sp. NPDC059023]|uniref:amino acid adenylation domain-containing protein n=1 Tax=unclassified Nonomuraea TaxID=2593643 RepID=UPI00369C94D9